MTIRREDRDAIEREAESHWHHGHQIPKTVNRVDVGTLPSRSRGQLTPEATSGQRSA